MNLVNSMKKSATLGGFSRYCCTRAFTVMQLFPPEMQVGLEKISIFQFILRKLLTFASGFYKITQAIVMCEMMYTFACPMDKAILSHGGEPYGLQRVSQGSGPGLPSWSDFCCVYCDWLFRRPVVRWIAWDIPLAYVDRPPARHSIRIQGGI